MTILQEFLNSPVKDRIRAMKLIKEGDLFGVELECEGKNVGFIAAKSKDILDDWSPHDDGSLRNNHGSSCEWIFNGPATYKKSKERINKLFDMFEANKSKLVTSNRTSTHVHFNMGDKHCYQLVNMFILFTILEDVFDSFCGEERKGNLFCLSSRYAEEQVRWVMNACFGSRNFLDFAEHMRYCSFNIASINKFGTVEFRGMRGLDNKEDLLQWLSILQEFCDYACYKMKNPVDIVEMISVKTPTGFLEEIFSGKNLKVLTQDRNIDDINTGMYEGLRIVQMLCYKIGTEFEGVTLRGRDFWSSLKEDQEPEKDVDPKDFGMQELNQAEIPDAARVIDRNRQGRLVDRLDAPAPVPWDVWMRRQL